MSNLIFEANGVRGRHIRLYDKKCVITTTPTVGSFFTGNITDGEQTIFLKDVVGVQFKRSGNLIGYLQFETPSMQMNNQNNNMFSENTFTFDLSCGLTNEIMQQVYEYVTARIEELKYGLEPGQPPAALNIAPPAPQVSYMPPVGYAPQPTAAPAGYVPQPTVAPTGYIPQPTAAPVSEVWFCCECGARNQVGATHCHNCGKPRSE